MAANRAEELSWSTLTPETVAPAAAARVSLAVPPPLAMVVAKYPACAPDGVWAGRRLARSVPCPRSPQSTDRGLRQLPRSHRLRLPVRDRSNSAVFPCR